MPVWPDDKQPDWLHPSFHSSLGLTNFSLTQTQELHYPNYPWGANISFSKALIEKHGGFRLDLGRLGQLPLAGEETELCLRFEKHQLQIVYVPNAEVYHVITPEQLTVEAFLKMAPCHGVSDARVEGSHSNRLRMMVKVLRRASMLFIWLAGWAWFAVLANPRYQLLCQFRARSLWAYLLTALGHKDPRSDAA